MVSELLERIKRFLIENRWEYNFPLTRDTQLQRDLKIWGDDADEILIKFSKEFNVDVSQFPIGDYFDDEGEKTFSGFYKLFRKKEKRGLKKVLTIGDLEKAAQLGLLDGKYCK